jgi:DNA-binding transcriptional regulator YdaS (Cro superfamily)
MGQEKQPYNVEAIQKACQLVGSAHKLSQLTGTSYMTVQKWRHGKATPSPLNCMRVEKATHGLIKKEEIRPEFDWINFSLF